MHKKMMLWCMVLLVVLLFSGCTSTLSGPVSNERFSPNLENR